MTHETDPIPETPEPSVALYDPLDQEQTRLTKWAKLALRHLLDRVALVARPAQEAYPVQFVRLRSGRSIVLEVHGQSSVTGHGKQGLRPDRIAFLHFLREQGFPVLLVFVEGMSTWRAAWLHDLGPAQPISYGEDGDRASMRYGWPVTEMEKFEGPLQLPLDVPLPKPKVQEALI